MTDDNTNASSSPSTPIMNHAELHRQQTVRLAALEAQVKTEQPLTSQRLPLLSLQNNYVDESVKGFVNGLESLNETYDQVRTVRGDGNCFYRAFLYSLAEQLLPTNDDSNEAAAAASNCRRDFIKHPLETNWHKILSLDGYTELTLEIFYDTMCDLIQSLSTPVALHDTLAQENASSDYCTWFLRLVTAAHLKLNAERFLPFVLNGEASESTSTMMNASSDNNSKSYANQVMHQFCATQVEPMGRECEHLQIMALAEAMHCRVVVEYLDGHSDKVTRHAFGPSDKASSSLYTIHLLYRPGHYDILYRKSVS
ncbi:hypothetical protein MPSEU_000625800 [Mayamaea pseudoterrestris]|nr:hypothetical protein MPSEU_000625800 [Mayamaea pseudoterrestris]